MVVLCLRNLNKGKWEQRMNSFIAHGKPRPNRPDNQHGYLHHFISSTRSQAKPMGSNICSQNVDKPIFSIFISCHRFTETDHAVRTIRDASCSWKHALRWTCITVFQRSCSQLVSFTQHAPVCSALGPSSAYYMSWRPGPGGSKILVHGYRGNPATNSIEMHLQDPMNIVPQRIAT